MTRNLKTLKSIGDYFMTSFNLNTPFNSIEIPPEFIELPDGNFAVTLNAYKQSTYEPDDAAAYDILRLYYQVQAPLNFDDPTDGIKEYAGDLITERFSLTQKGLPFLGARVKQMLSAAKLAESEIGAASLAELLQYILQLCHAKQLCFVLHKTTQKNGYAAYTVTEAADFPEIRMEVPMWKLSAEKAA